jgi:hypothetical protein
MMIVMNDHDDYHDEVSCDDDNCHEDDDDYK